MPKGSTADERKDHARKARDVVAARKDAAWAWDQIVPVLDSFSLLSTVDVFILIDFCRTWARIQRGERMMDADGMVVMSDHAKTRGNVRHPVSTILNQYRTHFRALIAELGLTPSSRGTGDIFPVAPSRPAQGKASDGLLD